MPTWNTDERAGLGNTAGYVQEIISVPLMRNNPQGGNFDLYYFRPDFTNGTTPFEKLDKTILFCLGGPGRVLKPHDNIWFRELSQYGYKIVYFHLRGSGFSQLPESNDKDEYIRTQYAADDIEKIREDVFKNNGKKTWDAVIGYSYGAVLAQQYASNYPEAADKLILIGPISLDGFKRGDPVKVYGEYEKEVKAIRISIIDAIYDLKIFREELKISDEHKEKIKEKLFHETDGIFAKIEKNFGSEQSVIDSYEILNERSGGKTALEKTDLNFEKPFFQALRDLQVYGRRTDNDGAVNQEAKLGELGEVIARALCILEAVPSVSEPQDAAAFTNAPRSIRVLQVMGVYDGINRRFIREWLLNGSKDVAKCIEQSSGIGWKYVSDDKNPSKKIGIIEKASIKPWSPADYPHDKSTLILKGSADPVTAAGQAESYLNYVGPQSILLNFEGVGHEFILPGVKVDSEDIYPMLRRGNADVLNCLLNAFVEKGWDEFRRVAEPIWGLLKAEEHLPVLTVKPEQPPREQLEQGDRQLVPQEV